MGKVITVFFDGNALVPETPLDLKPGTRYVITIGKALKGGRQPGPWEEQDDQVFLPDAPEGFSRTSSRYTTGTSGQ